MYFGHLPQDVLWQDVLCTVMCFGHLPQDESHLFGLEGGALEEVREIACQEVQRIKYELSRGALTSAKSPTKRGVELITEPHKRAALTVGAASGVTSSDVRRAAAIA